MRYATSRFIEWRREEAYRNYVCNSLQLQVQHKYLANTYNDFVNPKKKVPKEVAVSNAINVLKQSGVTFV